MSIQVFLPKFRTDECLLEIKECLDKGWSGMGFKTQQFEQQWCAYTGLPYAHFLNSNTAGLHLALHVLKREFAWQDNDEIITTPLTFISTNHAILYENLRPIFADVDNTLCLDPNSIAQRITKKTRAVLYVGIGGNTGQLSAVARLCKQNNLKLILDAAHMAGTRYQNKHVGFDADMTIFSFQAVKNLPTADSGMICCKEKTWDEAIRKLAWLGINKNTYARASEQEGYKWEYDVEHIGFKYHGNSIMAALGLVGLRYLDEDNKRRREMATLYEEILKDVPKIQFIEKSLECESAQHLFQIRVKNREALISFLNANKIFPGVHYGDNTDYTMYHYALNSCPNAKQFSREVLSLPLHLHLENSDISYIANLIKGFYDK